jgi:hypothetical protein
VSRGLAAVIAVVLLWPAPVSAHRLDEYLQALRVSLDRTGLVLELDLTPGASMASVIAALIDRDGDGAISPAEIETYGRSVLADLTVTLDDRALALTLMRIDAPPVADMLDGVGTIQLRATARADAGAGRRHVFVRNNHRSATSVYLINALLPDDRDITVVSQVRDPRQSSARIAYDIDQQAMAPFLWVAIGAIGLAALVMFRRRSMRPMGEPATA